MIVPVFVVLRAQPNVVQTIGPASEAFASIKLASAFATEMINRYPQQIFYVCQTVAVYEAQSQTLVKKFATPEPAKKRVKPTTKKKEYSVVPNSPNIYPMRARGSGGVVQADATS